MKLTVITINYNNRDGLIKTFDSIRNQTWLDFEYIVIDGGSTDGGKELIEQNPQINYWVSEKDSGVYNAMNKGILKATGDYVIFMNSGDFFYDENVLEKVQHHFAENIDILYGDTVCFNDNGFKKLDSPDKKLTFGFFCNKGINHQSAFIKRELFHRYFLYNEDYKICSDWEFFIVVICSYGASYKHMNEVICYYDFSGISSNPENFHIYEKERDITLRKYFPMFYDDYLAIKTLQTKRMQHIQHIKKNPVAWRIFKWYIDFTLLFLPKFKQK